MSRGGRARALALGWLLALAACSSSGAPESSVSASTGAGPRVLVVGDSNLFESFDAVEGALREHGIEPTIHGVPGYGLKDFAYWKDVITRFIEDEDPEVVIVGLGTNDAPDPYDVFRFPARLDALMEVIGARPVRWLTHVDDRPAALTDAGRAVNDLIRAAALRWENLTVIDFALEIAADPSILYADELHFSRHGRTVYAETIAQAAVTALAPPAVQP